jgi:hypothetical protein
LASRKSKEVEAACRAPDISLQSVGMMLADIGNLAAAHERVLVRLRDELGPFDPLLEAAEKLGGHWAALSTALVGKLADIHARAATARRVAVRRNRQPVVLRRR